MGSIFRSEEMALCQLFLSSEAAYNCVSEIGEVGLVQFRDLNPDVNAFQRKFVHEVRRCDEMDRKLRYLEKEILKDKLQIIDTGENPAAPQPREMIDLEATFEKLENELREVNANAETLKKNSLELTELKHVLATTQLFFQERDSEPNSSITQNLLPAEEGKGPVQLGFVCGVTNRERMPMFERMLWRVCRGNVFVRQSEVQQPLEDPVTGEEVFKTVFIIFFQGEQLKTKVKKICEGCRTTMYPCPESAQERKEMGQGVEGRLADLRTVLNQTTDHRHRVLAAAAKHLVHQGEEDEGHLPHPQHAQLGCDKQVPHCRVLNSHNGHGLHPGCPAQRNGACWQLSAADHQPDAHQPDATNLPSHHQVHRRLPEPD